jgi:hypothetical protein
MKDTLGGLFLYSLILLSLLVSGFIFALDGVRTRDPILVLFGSAVAAYERILAGRTVLMMFGRSQPDEAE